MLPPNLENYPYIKLDLVGAPAMGAGTLVPLTHRDIDALPGIAGCIDAILKVLPDHLEPHAILAGATIRLYLVSISPGQEGTNRAREACDEIVDLMERAADKLRENSQLLEPQPYKSLVTVKPFQSVFKTFAAANEQSPLRVALVHADGKARAFPVLATAELPSISTRAPDNMQVTSKIIGLIRGDQLTAHELIIEGGTHVILPAQSPWTWDDIHLLLESSHWIEGTLIRVTKSAKWTVDSDGRVTSQPVMI